MGIVTVHRISPVSGHSSETCAALQSIAAHTNDEGTLSKVFQVVLGEGSGAFFLHNIYGDLIDFSSKMQRFGPSAVDRRMEEMLVAPGFAGIAGPQLWKLVYSGDAGGNRPVVVQRQYDLPTSSIEGFVDLSAEIERIVSQLGADIRTSIPVISDDQQTLRMVFRYDSEVHWGEVEKSLADDRQMIRLFEEAERLGTLRDVRMLCAV